MLPRETGRLGLVRDGGREEREFGRDSASSGRVLHTWIQAAMKESLELNHRFALHQKLI
jgi:hypothetical protein